MKTTNNQEHKNPLERRAPNPNPFTKIRETADDSCNKPNGANAVSRPVKSGLGGLREDGIVGIKEPVGGSAGSPRVEGKRGAISGESS
ncbi:hypothetical protein MIMGU_mgv1a017243mg [Erythranthe guttata]|uniref:Uncharacterized protein n=1 Tax=Erythranthe guttata TaxID=4155 RepID=A0A022RYJ3_ERYGU|nr:hypothetical protein MIMGU_mgv1a017243mg [Erythranthe guttata]